MRVETEAFTLRPWEDGDAQELAEIANNKKIYDNLRDAFPHPYSLEDAKSYIASVKNIPTVSAIVIDGRIAGSIGAFIQSDVYRKNAEIGYFLAEKYWGCGIMTRAVSVVVQYIFGNYDIIRIYAEPFARNTGSRRVLEKAGFKLEAALKSNVIKNDIIEDSCIYSILRDEFMQSR